MKLPKLFSFLELLELFRKVDRVVYTRDEERWENDVEHSYQLAMTAWYLTSVNNFSLDNDLVIKYALVHDLVEAYAGDTFHFASEKERSEKTKREAEAAVRLKETFPEFGNLHSLIQGYEERKDPEAKFVYALDKLLPSINNYRAGGRIWREKGITLSMVISKGEKIGIAPEVVPYFEELVKVFEKEPELFAQKALLKK